MFSRRFMAALAFLLLASSLSFAADLQSVLIRTAKPYNKEAPLEKVVTADLESLITREGLNSVYMASWYGIFKVFDTTQYGYNSNSMLQAFRLSLLTEVKGCTVYFTTGLVMMLFYPQRLQ